MTENLFVYATDSWHKAFDKHEEVLGISKELSKVNTNALLACFRHKIASYLHLLYHFLEADPYD